MKRKARILASSSSSRETSPRPTSRSYRSAASTTAARQGRDKGPSIKAKKVQHSVRFADDNSDEGDFSIKKRSSSLDARRANGVCGGRDFRTPSRSRERHRSGGSGTVTGGDSVLSELQDQSIAGKTLHEIDRDIHKIWKELQELDKASGAISSRPPIVSGGSSSRSSPSRGRSSLTATPVKIRTFTTPIPSNSPVSSSIGSGSSPPSRTSVPPIPTTTTASSTTTRSIFDEPGLLSGSSPKSVRSYNPRRDHMEPTRPGNIKPVYGTNVFTTNSGGTSASGSPVHKLDSKTRVKTPGESGSSNVMEFYPRYETRPRVDSIGKKPDTSSGVPVIPPKQTHLQQQSRRVKFESDPVITTCHKQQLSDKACQTDGGHHHEEQMTKNSKKCSIS